MELTVYGKRLGRQPMPRNGHLKWNAVYHPGKVVATGCKNGKRILTETTETTKPASKLILKTNRATLKADGRDVAVITVEVQDAKGRVVPDACPMLSFRLDGHATIIGAGNGDPSYLGPDHPQDVGCKEFWIPAFNGLAQVLIQSGHEASPLKLSANSDRLTTGSVNINIE